MKTILKSFIDKNGMELLIQVRKSGIVFGVGQSKEVGHKHRFKFTEEMFREILLCLEMGSALAWDNFKPREADSEASDYDEYYDRPLDNNGYLSFDGDCGLYISRPSTESTRLYKFNKRRMESFIYDFRKKFPDYQIIGIDWGVGESCAVEKTVKVVDGKVVEYYE